MKKYILVAHVSDSYAPTYPFIDFISRNSDICTCILHPLVGYSKNESVMFESSKEYKNKQIYTKKYLKPNNTLSYLLHFFVTLFWIFKEKNRKDIYIYIGLNNLNAFSGLILKKLGFVKYVFYYSVDYSSKRFDNKIINAAYHYLDKICVKYCDGVFSVSPRIIEVRKKQGLDDKKNILCPNGVHLKNIPSKKSKERQILKVVYTGHITKSKGIHYVLEALKILKDKTIFFDIIGQGPFLKDIEHYISEYNLQEQVRLLGYMQNEDLLNKICDYDVGVALYDMSDEFNYYCDPVKVKEYLASGLIPITSSIPWIGKFLVDNKIGFIADNSNDIAKILNELKNESLYKEYTQNIIIKNLKLDWDEIFTEVISRANDCI